MKRVFSLLLFSLGSLSAFAQCPTVYSVSGGGAVCGTGVTVGLTSSQAGVNYQLLIGGVNTGSPIAGTGSSISWLNITAAGTYTIKGTNVSSGCTNNMSSSAVVTVSVSQIFQVTGSGNLCGQAPGATITLNGSESGVTYKLNRNGSLVTSTSGTGGTLTWNQTIAGTYTVDASKNSCTVTMNGNVVVTTMPQIFSVGTSGGTIICGGTGPSITLSSSASGVNYQLQINGTNSGAAVAGTGTALTWSNQTTPGTYSVVASTAAGCTATMSGSATMTSNNPQTFNVTGSGNLCGQAPGATITLSGSESGVTYKLNRNGLLVTSTSGTGGTLTWNQTIAGTYTVDASKSSCTLTMNGNVVVTSMPQIFSVTLSGSPTVICGSSGPDVRLSSSTSGVNYQLQLNGANSGAAVAGTGSALIWSNQTTPGTYTVVASTAAGCTATMSGSVTITSNTPQIFTLSGSGNLCGGGATATLSGSQTGVTYQLQKNGVNYLSSQTGTGSSISWSNLTQQATYTVNATKSSCSQVMNGNVLVDITPQAYLVSGGGTVCGTGVNVNLGNSQAGINYQLQINGVNSGSPIAGTGAQLVWSSQTTSGTYTFVGSTSSGCTTTMNGYATVANITPAIFDVTGGGCMSNNTTINLSGSQTGVTYNLQKSNNSLIMQMSGTGAALTWTNLPAVDTYSIIASNGSCQVNMNGTATTLASSAALNFSGGGTICTAGQSVSMSLLYPEPSVSYQLLQNGVAYGAPQMRNGGGGSNSIIWSVQQTGTYTVVGTNNASSCSTTMSGTAIVNALPVLFTVAGGGTICQNTSTNITLSGSEVGMNYQLVVNNTYGNVVVGTGSSLTWSVSTAGTYTIWAKNNTAGCGQFMTGSATVSVNPTPSIFNLTGGGTYCTTASSSVALANSTTGVNYQLQLNGVNNGNAVAGSTGVALTWNSLTAAGTYSVVATNTSTSCTQTMSGNPVVNIVALPTAYAVSGGGSLCTGGLNVSLSGSQTGYSYQLQINGSNSGPSIAGTNSALTWANQTTPGTYAVITTVATCPSQPMTGSATIDASRLPTSYTVSGGGNYCSGGSGVSVALGGSQSGINYQLQLNGVNNGSTVSGTGSGLSWPGKTSAGTYTIVATNTSTGCVNTMIANAIVTVIPLPTSFTVYGGGSYCPGGSGVAVSLIGSETGVNYQLQISGTNSGATVAGTGAPLTWSNQTTTGSYTISATRVSGSCFNAMTGSVPVAAGSNPVVFTVGGGGTYCSGAAGLPVTLSGSESGVAYKLFLNGASAGSALTGTGSSLTWPSQLASGTYTVTALNVQTECTSNMSGNPAIAINAGPTNFTLTGGGIIPASSSATVQLSGSETGVSYQLLLNDANSGASVPGTGSALNWPSQTAEGAYTVMATKSSNSCALLMSGEPEIVFASTSTISLMSNYAFQYQYDGRNRMTAKKIPGADWVYMVYDDRDRLVLTQDGNQRLNNQWIFTKYDAFNRPVSTGIYTDVTNIGQANMQTAVNSFYTNLASTSAWYETFTVSDNFHNYDNKSFPQVTDANAFLTVTYYDDNSSLQSLWGSSYVYVSDNLTSGNSVQPANDNRKVKGNPVAAKTKVLDGTNAWLKSIMFYDTKYRVIQTLADNAKGGSDRVSNLYDFVGKILATKTTHKTSGHSDQTVARLYTYDHAGRLLTTQHSVNGATPVLLAKNEYNEVGQLVDKKLYSTDGTNFKQSVDYRYNIRGWLTSINNAQLAIDGTNDDTNDLFGMNLHYNDAVSGLSTSNDVQYNGNISAIEYSANQGVDIIKERGYRFGYDAMNRLLSATHNEKTTAWNVSPSYHENNLSYDLNGNVQSLTRKGANGSTLDVLTYNYGTGDNRGNKLLGVVDDGDKTKGFVDGNTSGDDYSYDANGNMNHDLNKSIGSSTTDNAHSISYNHLNLPTQVIKNTGEKIAYTYDASGRKLKQQVYNASGSVTKTTEYDGEFIYQGDTLQFINHEEGRVVMKNVSSPEYQYHLKDHLGNVRMTFTTVPTTQTDVATYETANQTAEQSKFSRYANARRINSIIFDHTNGSATGYAERLNGSANERFGLAKSISVMPGDVVQTEVYAKYVDANPNNLTAALATLLGQIASNTAGVVVDGSAYASSTSSFPANFGDLLNKTDDGAPKAYLNWLVFDRNYTFITGGFKQITTVGRENGSDVPHEYLTSGNIAITQPGYVYIYLSNENAAQVEVYFDDFKVTQTKSPVVQSEDFYPFGLSFNSYTRENAVAQNYLFNDGTEQVNDLSLGWQMTNFRLYDPTVGRFLSIDPLADLFSSVSPMVYAYDNPISYNDPLGLDPEKDPIVLPEVVVTAKRIKAPEPSLLAPVALSLMGGPDPFIRGSQQHFNYQANKLTDALERWRNRRNKDTMAKKASDYVDPAGLIIDGVTVLGFDTDGRLMKMQSGQKMMFFDKRIIDILKSTGAAKSAITIGTIVKGVGTSVGYAGLVLTWIQVRTGEKHWITASMDTAVGIVGMAVPGPGTVVAGFYFLATQDYGRTNENRNPTIIPTDNTFVTPSYPAIK